MEWNVFLADWNNKSIKRFNIFKHTKFRAEIEKALEDTKSKEELAEKVKFIVFYFYGSKCEYEIVITEWPTHVSNEAVEKMLKDRQEYKDKNGHYPYNTNIEFACAEKIDVRTQVLLNYDAFINYIWSFKK